MLELKDGGKYVRRDGQEVIVKARKYGDDRWSHYCFIGDDLLWRRADGLAYEKEGSTCDLVSECPPPFSISPGNYYRTRDGRKAYVACGPVEMPKEYEWPPVFYGHIDTHHDDVVDAQSWNKSGLSDVDGSDGRIESEDDLVSLWHPETLTDPTTGKKYRVAEEVT